MNALNIINNLFRIKLSLTFLKDVTITEKLECNGAYVEYLTLYMRVTQSGLINSSYICHFVCGNEKICFSKIQK